MQLTRWEFIKYSAMGIAGVTVAGAAVLATIGSYLGGGVKPMKLVVLDPPVVHAAGAYSAIPSRWDWRDVNGRDYTTLPRDQLDCGACGPFAAMGAAETIFNILTHHQGDFHYPDPDLSEADIFWCGKLREPVCEEGMSFYEIMLWCETMGVIPEYLHPYIGRGGKCADRNIPDIQVYHRLTDWVHFSHDDDPAVRDQIKQHVIEVGPVMSMYELPSASMIENGVARLGGAIPLELVDEGLYTLQLIYLGQDTESLNNARLAAKPILLDLEKKLRYAFPNRAWHAETIIGWDDSKGVWITKDSGRGTGMFREEQPYGTMVSTWGFRGVEAVLREMKVRAYIPLAVK
jgi:hypothetical protein